MFWCAPEAVVSCEIPRKFGVENVSDIRGNNAVPKSLRTAVAVPRTRDGPEARISPSPHEVQTNGYAHSPVAHDVVHWPYAFFKKNMWDNFSIFKFKLILYYSWQKFVSYQ